MLGGNDDGQSHVAISMFHPYKVVCNFAEVWIGLIYPWHTHSIPECHGQDLSQRIYAIARWVEGVLAGNGVSRWSVTCSHIQVASIQSVLYYYSVVG